MKRKNQPLKIIQIVPQLPPSINGLGDYALNLARQLWKDYEIETLFVVGHPNWQGATAIEDFPIQQVLAHSAEALFFLLSTDSNQLVSDPTVPVLLHYVGYGYAKRGCPVWLVEGLERWKTNNPKSCLVTMFHELNASGPPWKSAFWLSGQQRNLVARLAQLSNSCLTSQQLYAETLYELSHGKQTQIHTLPIFSNIGESEQVSPLAKRHRRLVVFGSGSSRLKVYRESLIELRHACQVLAIEKIWDIGPSIDLTLYPVKDVPVVEIGSQPAGEISAILSNSLAGFIHHDPDFLAKSGIFAAYCAHGLLPVNTRSSVLQLNGIKSGEHYWVPDAQTTSLKNIVEAQTIATNAYSWYQTHNLTTQTKIFANQLLST